MSNYLAIATVTAALRQMLADGVSADVNTTDVTILPPDHATLKDDVARLNLFLFQVTPNGAWRSADLPTRRTDGTLATKPQLGLELHYLLTAYGKATQEDPEIHRVLGSAMRTLHERPVLTRDAIRSVLNGALGASDLAEQLETVKLTLQAISTDELAKLWQVFSQTPYRLSLVYRASVVLIEGRETSRPVLPVSERKIHIFPFRQPHIESISPQAMTSRAALTIRGQSLKGASTKVKFGATLVAPSAVSDTEIEVTLPDGMKAGVNTLQVVHELDFGTGSGLHRGFESNVMPYVLRPTVIEPVSVTPEPPVSPPPAHNAHNNFDLTVHVDPVVRKGQSVTILLNECILDHPASYAIDVGISEDTGALKGSLTAPKTGDYLVRVRADGAESATEADLAPKSPTSNRYTGKPSVTIECATNCLRCSGIQITVSATSPPGNLYMISAQVTVQDENNNPVKGAQVTALWTRPDGTTEDQRTTTDVSGVAISRIPGAGGDYAIRVANIELDDYTFDALKSIVLTKTETVS